MGSLRFVEFIAEEFPGETQELLKFSAEDWKEIFILDSDCIKYASFRVPVFFVGEEEMRKWVSGVCCISRDLLRELREKLHDLKEKEMASEPLFVELEEEIERKMRPEREKYERVAFPARYVSNFQKGSYSGPAVLIAPERLERRIKELEGYYELGEWISEFERQDLLKKTLRAIYAHEATRSYIDAWSTQDSFSRRKLSHREKVDAFYHLILEESIATAVEVWEYWAKGERRHSILSSLYPQYLLARFPAEHLGFYHLINSFEGELHFRKELSMLGGLADSYCSESSPPPSGL